MKTKTRSLSWPEFKAIAHKRESGELEGWHNVSTTNRYGDRDWYGTYSLDEALQLAEHGWAEGTAQILRNVPTGAISGLAQLIPALHYDVAGEFPDVGAYCAGEPEHMVWQDADRADVQPVVKIAFAGSASCNVKGREIINYGIAALSYIDALQTSGRSVEIYWHSYLRDTKGAMCCLRVAINNTAAPIDADRLAFMLAHPSMFRRLGFANIEAILDWESLGSGIGVPRPLPESFDAEGFIRFPTAQDMRKAGALGSARAALHFLESFIAKDGNPDRHAA